VAARGLSVSVTTAQRNTPVAAGDLSVRPGQITPHPQVSAVPSIPKKRSQRSASVPEAGPSVLGSVQPQLLSLEPGLVGSGADFSSNNDDPAWGSRTN